MLTDPGVKCQGEKATLACTLKRKFLSWKYSGHTIGIDVISSDQDYTVTIGLLGIFFDKSAHMSDEGFLSSSLSFAADLTMNGSQVKCEGPGVTFTRTLKILSRGNCKINL